VLLGMGYMSGFLMTSSWHRAEALLEALAKLHNAGWARGSVRAANIVEVKGRGFCWILEVYQFERSNPVAATQVSIDMHGYV
jgi:hypothetical protein